jgi:hypothetical protein
MCLVHISSVFPFWRCDLQNCMPMKPKKSHPKILPKYCSSHQSSMSCPYGWTTVTSGAVLISSQSQDITICVKRGKLTPDVFEKGLGSSTPGARPNQKQRRRRTGSRPFLARIQGVLVGVGIEGMVIAGLSTVLYKSHNCE